MVFGSEMRLHRKLKHRNIGLRIHQHQRHPGAVIEAAAPVDAAGEAGRAQQVRNPRGDRRRAGRRIAHLIKRAREAAEVVDRVVAHRPR